MSDKIIVTNKGVLLKKYKSAGVEKITAALSALAEADEKKGLETTVVDLGDAGAMARYGGAAVGKAADRKANKLAVDAVCQAVRPDYLVLLGAADVIPHQRLTNPAQDPDKYVYSDLPYMKPSLIFVICIKI